MQRLNYEFGALDNGEAIGWNEPATVIFSHISRTLVREALQNVIDATVTAPAVIKFSCFETPVRSFIPDPDKLIKIYDACADEVSDDKYAKERFVRASKILNNNKTIRVLKISDYNTTGLIGGDRQKGHGGNFFAFMHSVGITSKGAGTGGSFGLGKGSFYASSDLRTIFVVSKTATDHVFQGKLRLVTHKLDGIEYQATGSFGIEGQRPLRGLQGLVSSTFKRDEIGTDIYIPAYLGDDNWAETIIRAALAYFWLAILQEKIIIEVEGVHIDSNNLRETVTQYFTKKVSKEIPDPTPYIRAFTDTESHKSFKGVLPTLGHVELYILTGEQYPSHVAYFRGTGMQIKTIQHGLPQDYAGVFICDDLKGNELLKQMENATHDEWDPENAEKYGAEIVEEGKRAIKEVQKFVREKLDTLIDMGNSESITIPGVEEVISLPIEEGEKGTIVKGKKGQESVDLDVDTTVRRIQIKKPKDPKPPSIPSHINLPIIARSYAKASKSKMIHHVILRGEPGQMIDVVGIMVGTEDKPDIKSIHSVEVNGKRTKIINDSEVSNIKFDDQGRASLSVDFGDNEKYSLQVSAYKKITQ